MKKIILTLFVALMAAGMATAQKFALVDMDYILRNVPAYEMANEQLNQVSQRWEKEVNELSKAAETMYKNYQSDMVFLTEHFRQQRAVLFLQLRAQQVDNFLRAVNVGLEVPQIGMAVAIFFTADLAGRDFLN